MTEVFAIIGIVLVTIPAVLALSLFAVMWRSWWLYPAWAWFIVPLGLPAISFWHFTALLFLVQSLQSTDVKKNDRGVDWTIFTLHYLWPIAAWALLRWMR